MRHWGRAAGISNMRGLFVIYFQQDPHVELVERLVEAGVNVFVVGTIAATNCVL
jgi:hypothetical protein